MIIALNGLLRVLGPYISIQFARRLRNTGVRDGDEKSNPSNL